MSSKDCTPTRVILMFIKGSLGRNIDPSSGIRDSQAENSPRDAQCTPPQSAAQDTSLLGTASSQGTADLQGTAHTQGTAKAQSADDIPKSPNDYTPTDAS
ncbi:hypothetical protein Tco_1481570 [Tanacetum coccineum]